MVYRVGHSWFAIRQRIIAGATDVGIVVLKERSGGSLGTYTIWSGDIFQLDRFNVDGIIFFMYIMNRNINMFDLAC